MSNEKTDLLIKSINIIFESIEFIILSYILLSGMFSFKTNPIYILFFAVNIVVIQKFWAFLRKTLMNNIITVTVFVICIIALTILFLNFGYLSMSLVSVKIS
ncbi:hypothetical protein [Defluviitalea phaphyphila]|uniref:hypothetical protein n=1 Tax=Defluviitalea phaphyphila TaxID=1473580 RepID=UPI000731BEBC|nr:hypothetical protein [Defluviitalea phaphyphila]